MFKDDKLKGIAITKADGELLAFIPDNAADEMIQANDVLIRFNYSDEEYEFEDREGKVYIKE